GSRAGVSYPLPAIIEEHLPIIIFVSVGLGRSTLPLAADCFLPRSLLATDDARWREMSGTFAKALEDDVRLEPFWINTNRYPLALYNIFTALGFEVYSGPLPRISGVQPEWRYPFLAYSPMRAVLLDDQASAVFTDLAEIQPLCPVPILGLSYNGALTSGADRGWSNYPERTLVEGRRIANALAIGHVALSIDDLKEALILHPSRDCDRLFTIAERTGISSFLNPALDALPTFGQNFASDRGLKYTLENFLADAERTTASGAHLAVGDITQAQPTEALSDPDYYFRELNRAKLIARDADQTFRSTNQGRRYLRAHVLPFPLSQLLYHACTAAREEARGIAGVFVDALRERKPTVEADTQPWLLPIDDVTSFAKVALVPRHLARAKVPVTLPEADIKKLICNIVNDAEKKDWPGEQNDIFTTRVLVDNKRRLAAFMLKGPAVKGRLTLSRCGKNGDQIQRLFQSTAEIFFIQYNGTIDERVYEEARQKTWFVRAAGNQGAVCTIIDGQDTARLIQAYAEHLS
ncbi:MAG TPA: hypothetical protein VNN08_14175, partial [Thermoanaerobaculia bacterium]|nr:hypothetical protein [Thermoanaerobaculia bacterium]